MNFDPRNREHLLGLIAGIAVVLLIGNSLIINPLINSWRERSTRIEQLRRDIAKGQRTLERERSIHDLWDSMRTNMLPDDVSVAEGAVLKAFDRWSQSSRISITSVKPQWKRTADDFLTLEYRVDAFGSLSTVCRFLYDVEHHDPLTLKVELVELGARDAEGSQLTLALQVSGVLLNPQEQ